MPRPRFENASPALKLAILEAASREFGERGYEAASLNQIIEASGLSKGSFYYYFDDKVDLAATVFAQAAVRLAPPAAVLEAATDAASFWTRFERLNRDSMAALAASAADLKLVGRLGGAYVDHPELAAKVAPLVGELSARWLRAMEHGVSLGAVRADVPLPVLLVAVQGLKESLVKVFMGGGAVPSPEVLERFVAINWDLARRVLAPEAPVVPGNKEAS
jgi:AcrR family transcriptional regulator